MVEVAGKGACFVNPSDHNSIKNGVLKVIRENKYRTELIKFGYQNVKRFSSDKISNEYLNLYKDLYMKNNKC